MKTKLIVTTCLFFSGIIGIRAQTNTFSNGSAPFGTGNVGIGTLSPQYPLHIISGDNGSGYNGTWGYNGLLIKNTGAWGASVILENSSSTPVRWHLSNSSSVNSNYTGNFFISRLDGGGTFDAMTFRPNGRIAVNDYLPGNTFQIKSLTGDPYEGSSYGSSGLRFTSLNSSHSAVPNGTNGVNSSKVLSVDQNGDVVLVNAIASNTVTAKNGLNTTAGWPDIELGGNLIRHTSVTTGVGTNMCFNGNGQFAITDYTSGNNSNASNLNGLWRAAIYTNTANIGLSVNNIKTVQASGTQKGSEVIVDLDNGWNWSTTGESVSVLNDGSNTIVGLSASAKARTSTSSGSNVGSVIGSIGSAYDGNFTIGGIFTATSNVTAFNTTTKGVEVWANGGGSAAYGGLFYALNSPTGNLGIYSIARNPNSAASPYTGVKAIADAVTTGGKMNYGVDACAQNDCSGGAIAVRGTLSFATIPAITAPNAHIAVYGDATVYGVSGQLNCGSIGRWAGYFDGDTKVVGTPYSLYNPVTYSDESIKKNVRPIKSAMSVLEKLQPKTYNLYNDNCKQLNITDTKLQYGLIAQEVEKVIPEIVYQIKVPGRKDSTGTTIIEDKQLKGVSYIQLIPLLIKGTQEQQELIEKQAEAIKEQQKQIDELKAIVKGNVLQNENSESKTISPKTITISDKNALVLNQNVPNPFAESTVITYNIPNDFAKAQLIFSTSDGKVIKTVDITSTGEGRLNVFANDLSSGMYSYSLVIDGKTIDTKKMVKN